MNYNQFFEILVNNHCPDEWEECNYDAMDTTAPCFTISEADEEFIKIAQPFIRAGYPPTLMERVQNPYKYGQYLLRKEQMKIRYSYTDEDDLERVKYHPVEETNVKVAVETACDSRRYNPCRITPCFYESVTSICDKDAVIVVKQLVHSPQDIWPMYVVHLN